MRCCHCLPHCLINSNGYCGVLIVASQLYRAVAQPSHAGASVSLWARTLTRARTRTRALASMCTRMRTRNDAHAQASMRTHTRARADASVRTRMHTRAVIRRRTTGLGGLVYSAVAISLSVETHSLAVTIVCLRYCYSVYRRNRVGCPDSTGFWSGGHTAVGVVLVGCALWLSLAHHREWTL